MSSVLSDTDFLFPTLSSISPVQERLASYYTIAGVLSSLPSPVSKRVDHTMKWAESIRLPKKIRDSKEIFNMLIDEYGEEVTTSKREDYLLDVLPFMLKVKDGRDLKKTGMRRNLKLLCGFPLRGRMIVDDEEMDEDGDLVTGKTFTGGWLIDDDIED